MSKLDACMAALNEMQANPKAAFASQPQLVIAPAAVKDETDALKAARDPDASEMVAVDINDLRSQVAETISEPDDIATPLEKGALAISSRNRGK